MFRYLEQAEKTAEEISKLYLKSSRYISLELDEIFERYQKKHKLSEKEAFRLLSSMKDKTSLDELKAALRSDGSDKTKADILAELESPAYQARLERLQQLQNQLDMTMQNVYQQEKITSTGHYVDLANEAYYRSIFDIQQRSGLNFGFSLISPAAVDRVVNSKWSGANYSARIWNNTKALAQDLKEELLLSLVTGRTDRETADIIANKFATGASQARRIVRTESCNLSNQMEMVSYEECGIEYYIYVATLDLRTSSICRSLDGKRFKVSEQQPGINCPPMHPWCRSTTISDIGDEELSQMKRRARDPVSGKTNTVPANMTYEDWYGKNVKGKREAELNEKMIQNRSADRRQFERYKEILGEEAPKTLDSFQKMKYTNDETFSFTKLDYERRKQLADKPELKLPGSDNPILPDKKFTNYLFGGDDPRGLAKGKAFNSRLGYDAENWKDLQEEIQHRASLYPSTFKQNNGYGDLYEQKMILYGTDGKPANVIVGWIHRPDGTTSMTSTYIKEV
ncbi:MAG: phage head morphogenesis protein [Hungatella sp.]|nr:phage head morphogenesis protein [Hungatella sp.]